MQLFILPRYILREHLGPFCFSFAMITLLFLLDLVFSHVSRVLSKGLPPAVVVELFSLNLAWIVATVAPLAVLAAILMAFGRLAADNEITAMQAGGASLWRQALPIFIAASALAAGSIGLSNNVLPGFNFRARVPAVDESTFFYRGKSGTRTGREKSVTAKWQELEESRGAAARLAQNINSFVGADLEKDFGQSFGFVSERQVSAPANSNAGLLVEQKRALGQISNRRANLQYLQRNVQKLLVEIQKKYAIAVACLILVLLGAPLGVLARRGRLATSTAVSLGFFLLYWACLLGGEDLADRDIVSPFMAMWPAHFLSGRFAFSAFRRIATGKFAPRSLRAESWFSRFSFRHLFGKFRRRKNQDESLYRLTRYEPLEMETRQLVWDSEGEDNSFAGEGNSREDNNNDVTVFPTMRPPESRQPAAREAMPKSAPTVASSPLAFTPVAGILNQFTNRIRANLVLLADRNGIPLAHDHMPKVKLLSPVDLEMMAKLAAGQIAATREIARTVEDDGRIDSILQEGSSWNSFIYPINEDYNLIAIVEKSVVIGLVRVQANEVVRSLRQALEMI